MKRQDLNAQDLKDWEEEEVRQYASTSLPNGRGLTLTVTVSGRYRVVTKTGSLLLETLYDGKSRAEAVKAYNKAH